MWVYTQNEILHSNEKEESADTCNMALECIMLSKTSQRQMLYGFFYMCNLKYKTNSQKHRLKGWLPEGGMGGWSSW